MRGFIGLFYMYVVPFLVLSSAGTNLSSAGTDQYTKTLHTHLRTLTHAGHVIVDPEFYDHIPEPTDEENDMLDLAFGLTETYVPTGHDTLMS